MLAIGGLKTGGITLGGLAAADPLTVTSLTVTGATSGINIDGTAARVTWTTSGRYMYMNEATGRLTLASAGIVSGEKVLTSVTGDTGVVFGPNTTQGIGFDTSAGHVKLYSSSANQWYIDGATGNWRSPAGTDRDLVTNGSTRVGGVVLNSGGAITVASNATPVTVTGDTTSPARAAFAITPQDAAPTGASVVGDMYVDTAGVLYICTTAGTPGTFTKVGTQT